MTPHSPVLFAPRLLPRILCMLLLSPYSARYTHRQPFTRIWTRLTLSFKTPQHQALHLVWMLCSVTLLNGVRLSRDSVRGINSLSVDTLKRVFDLHMCASEWTDGILCSCLGAHCWGTFSLSTKHLNASLVSLSHLSSHTVSLCSFALNSVVLPTPASSSWLPASPAGTHGTSQMF